MTYVLCGDNQLRYHPCVEEFGQFLLQYPDYFAILPEILLRSRNNTRVINSFVNEALDRGSITEETVNDFKRLLSDFIELDNKESGNFKGKLVEYIVAHISPQTFSPATLKRIKKCQILDLKNNCFVGGNKNFDLGVYNEYIEFKDLQLELIECKTNIENFLFQYPRKTNTLELNNKAKSKLDYIKTVKEKLQGCKHLAPVLATISRGKSINRSLKALQQNGYNFIIIIDYRTICKALTTQKK